MKADWMHRAMAELGVGMSEWRLTKLAESFRGAKLTFSHSLKLADIVNKLII